jgi:hypothetical protein
MGRTTPGNGHLVTAPDSDREWIGFIPFSSGSSFLGRLSLIGGMLVLTSDAVVFKPLGRFGRRKIIPLTEILDVSAYAERPPRLRISVRGRKPLVLGVVPTRTTPTWSVDATTRDEAVTAIRALSGRI